MADERRRKAPVCKRFHFNLIRRLRGSCTFLLLAMLAATGTAASRTRPPDDNDVADSDAKVVPALLNDPELVSGFQLLHHLQLDPARQQFLQWEQQHGTDALG